MNTVKRFWNWIRDETGQTRTLYLTGPIAEESWCGDEVTPRQFKDELFAGSGDITVWIQSPGGDVFAATQIYNALMEYPGQITVKVDGLCASAASIVAMAGGEVYMSPVSFLMIHNPATIAVGDGEEMLRAKTLLDEVREGIINAYELKTGLSRAKIGKLMDNETWMNARKAVDLGFADGILYTDDNKHDNEPEPSIVFSCATVMNSILSKMPKTQKPPEPPPPPTGTPLEPLMQRLLSISH